MLVELIALNFHTSESDGNNYVGSEGKAAQTGLANDSEFTPASNSVNSDAQPVPTGQSLKPHLAS
jgi:hypothetical protein